MADRFQFARGTAAEWTAANPVLREGELGLVTDTGLYKIGNGTSAWNSLPYREISAGAVTSLLMTTTTDPAAPAPGTAYIYTKEIAGRILPKFVGPAGLDTPIQPAFFGNGVRIAGPGLGAALSYFGMGALTAVGTISHPALAANNLREQTSRAVVTSAATANSASELRYAAQQCWRGNGAGMGGFYAVFRWGISSAVATQRVLVGLFTSLAAIATTQEPSTVQNGIWVGNDAADANLQLMYNDGSGTASKINLGADFVKNQPNAIYELVLFCKPNDTKVSYRVKRLDAAGEASGELTTDIPTNTTFLAPHFYVNNGGTAAAVILDFYRFYLETDY